MNRIKLWLAATCLLLGTTSFAQTPNLKIDETPGIEITGTAEKEIIPDEIYISITLKEKSKSTIQEQEEKMKTVLKTSGIDLKNLYLSDANADYIPVTWLRKDVVTTKSYMLKVGDAETVGKVFQELDKLDIKDANIARVNHSQLENIKKDIKIKAIQAAKDKATYLLAAIGEQLGKPLSIRENDVYATPVAYANQVYKMEQVNTGGYTTEQAPLQFQKIKVQASVWVKFSIK